MRLGTSLVVVSLFGAAHARADALTDTLGPREIAVGEAMRGNAVGSTASVLNPAGLPLTQELAFEGAYGYRSSDSASLLNISACDSTNALPGCFYYSYAGSNPELMMGTTNHRATQLGGLALAYPIASGVSFGTNGKYYSDHSNVAGESDYSGVTFDFGLNYRVRPEFSIGGAVYNVFNPDSPDFRRAAGGGVMVRPFSILSLSFDARWLLANGDHSARYGGGAELFLSSGDGQMGYPIRAGVLRDNSLGTTYVSGGLGISAMQYGVDAAIRHAVDGGDETLFIASLRIFGPRMQPGQSFGDQ